MTRYRAAEALWPRPVIATFGVGRRADGLCACRSMGWAYVASRAHSTWRAG